MRGLFTDNDETGVEPGLMPHGFVRAAVCLLLARAGLGIAVSAGARAAARPRFSLPDRPAVVRHAAVLASRMQLWRPWQRRVGWGPRASAGLDEGDADEPDEGLFTSLRKSEARMLDSIIQATREAETHLESLRRRHRQLLLDAGIDADFAEHGVEELGGGGAAPPIGSASTTDLASRLPAWRELRAHARSLEDVHLRELLRDRARAEALCVEHDGLMFDFSRQRMTGETLDRLLALASQARLAEKIRAMFCGEKINRTERRAAAHTALRMPRGSVVEIDGEDVMADVHAARDRVSAFSDTFRAGRHFGATGKPLKNIIVIGIGGSSLGPAFLYEALKATRLATRLGERQIRFLANIDEVDTARAIEDLDPAETLVIVTSKSFRTRETLINACTLRQWLCDSMAGLARPDQITSSHIAACTCDVDAAARWGVSDELTFPFWDWVGGRYSVTSSVGQLPIACAFGADVFDQFLDGCRSMDEHFSSAPFAKNIPVLMGLVGVWNREFLGHSARAIFPYCEALWRLPAHVQQVDMESNGKRVTLSGEDITDYLCGEVDFGEPGTTGQHSFFQLLHMGQTVPADFIGFAQPPHPMAHETVAMEGSMVSHHDELMANFFAQPDALACGLSAEELRTAGVSESLVPHRTFPGNRPSSVLLMPQLTPFSVGQILALYEHRTAVQGFVWGINSFDQWGVELGKQLAAEVRTEISDARATGSPPRAPLPSTERNLRRYISLSNSASVAAAKARARAASIARSTLPRTDARLSGTAPPPASSQPLSPHSSSSTHSASP